MNRKGFAAVKGLLIGMGFGLVVFLMFFVSGLLGAHTNYQNPISNAINDTSLFLMYPLQFLYSIIPIAAVAFAWGAPIWILAVELVIFYGIISALLLGWYSKTKRAWLKIFIVIIILAIIILPGTFIKIYSSYKYDQGQALLNQCDTLLDKSHFTQFYSNTPAREAFMTEYNYCDFHHGTLQGYSESRWQDNLSASETAQLNFSANATTTPSQTAPINLLSTWSSYQNTDYRYSLMY